MVRPLILIQHMRVRLLHRHLMPLKKLALTYIELFPGLTCAELVRALADVGYTTSSAVLSSTLYKLFKSGQLRRLPNGPRGGSAYFIG